MAGARKEKGGTMIVVSDGEENEKPDVSEVVGEVRIIFKFGGWGGGVSHFQMGGGEDY